MERTLISGEPRALLAAVSSKQLAPCWHEPAVCTCVRCRQTSDVRAGRACEPRVQRLHFKDQAQTARQVTVTDLVAKRAEARVRHSRSVLPLYNQQRGKGLVQTLAQSYY